jgi:hypothetical protein
MAPAHLFQSALALSDLERFYLEVRHTSEQQSLDVDGNFLDLNRLRPKLASPRKAGVQQMFGDVGSGRAARSRPTRASARSRARSASTTASSCPGSSFCEAARA